MKALLYWTLAGVVALGGFSLARSRESGTRSASLPSSGRAEGSLDTTPQTKQIAEPAKEQLIGAWYLVSLEFPGADGKVNRVADLKGMLLYTRDGHMSVQLMYPKSESGLTNEYVKNGYEASFGSYEVNDAAHTVTHHVQGSITEGLVGKELPRAFQIADGRLVIKSTRADEHWSVTWEHY